MVLSGASCIRILGALEFEILMYPKSPYAAMKILACHLALEVLFPETGSNVSLVTLPLFRVPRQVLSAG
jgi:hypothetical protein